MCKALWWTKILHRLTLGLIAILQANGIAPRVHSPATTVSESNEATIPASGESRKRKIGESEDISEDIAVIERAEVKLRASIFRVNSLTHAHAAHTARTQEFREVEAKKIVVGPYTQH